MDAKPRLPVLPRGEEFSTSRCACLTEGFSRLFTTEPSLFAQIDV